MDTERAVAVAFVGETPERRLPLVFLPPRSANDRPPRLPAASFLSAGVGILIFVVFTVYKLRRKLLCWWCLPCPDEPDRKEVLAVADALFKASKVAASSEGPATTQRPTGQRNSAVLAGGRGQYHMGDLECPLSSAASEVPRSGPSRALTWSELGLPSPSMASTGTVGSQSRLERMSSFLRGGALARGCGQPQHGSSYVYESSLLPQRQPEPQPQQAALPPI